MKRLSSRVALALFRASLLLLPARLRERAGAEMEDVFAERTRRARGLRALLTTWMIEFGGLAGAAMRARVHALSSRAPHNSHFGPSMDTLAQDVRFALRGVTRRPLTATLTVATLGLGIAASTAMFSVADAVLLRPLPYPEPERIVSLYVTNPGMAGHATLGQFVERGWFSFGEFADIQKLEGGPLGAAAALGSASGILEPEDGPAERIRMVATHAALFTEVLGVRPLLGRTFTEEDERTRFAGILLAEDFWRRRFGADPEIVGRVLDISGHMEVIGVLPADFALEGWPADAWVLLPPGTSRTDHSLQAIGRLAPGVDAATAAAALTQAFQAAAPPEPGHSPHEIRAMPRQEEEVRLVKGPLSLLVAAAAALLLVACGNVAVLLLGAALDREQELGVRGALGAGRTRLARQLFTEALVLAGTAGLLGVGLAHAALEALVLLAPPGVPRIATAAVDARALGFTVAAAFACALLFGLGPALLFSRADAPGALLGTRGSTRRGRTRLQGLVVVGELTMATVLLVGAGLLGRTSRALANADMGFAAPELLQVSLSIPFQRLLEGLPPDQALSAMVGWYERIQGTLETIPGVAGVAMTSNLPLTGDRGNNDIQVEGWTGEPVVAERRFVSWNFFDVVGTPLVEGRGFQPSDDRPDAAGTMVVSRGVAELFWPGESAVGKQVRYWERDVTVVGVAENVRDEGVREGTDLAYYVPRLQAGQPYGQFLVRTERDPAGLVEAVRSGVWALEPGIAIPTIRPLLENRDEAIASERYRARLVGVFSALAAMFALMGIYGVTSRSVASRTRELGVRVALGARRGSVFALVLKQGLRLAVSGALAGVALSFVVTRLIESYLWGVERTDIATLAVTALALAAASVLAALGPGLRASRADPMEALRSE